MDMSAPAPTSEPQFRSARLAMISGSADPHFCGVHAYHLALVPPLRQLGMDVETIDLGAWQMSQLPRLLRAVAAARPDVIVLQYPTYAYGYSMLPQAFAAVQRSAPLVVVLHEFSLAHPLRRLAVAGLLPRATRIVMTSDGEARALGRWQPWLRRRLHVVPIGSTIPGREWRPAAVPTVATFGQIRPEKGIEDFLACHDALLPRFPGTRFVMIGSSAPKHLDYYQRMLAEFERRGIAVLSNLSNEDVSDQLSAATLAISPIGGGVSFRRSSFLSAAACGTPIAAYIGPETPAELRAVLPEVTTRDQLIAASAAILADPTARAAAHQRSRQITALASWDGIAQQFAQILANLERDPS